MNEIETVLAEMGYTPDAVQLGWWHPPGEPDVWIFARAHTDANFVVEHLLPWLHSKGVAWEVVQGKVEDANVWCGLTAHSQASGTCAGKTLTEAVLKATAKAADAGWFAELAEQERARQ